MNKLACGLMVCLVNGCSGADGADGSDGMDGRDGVDGVDGSDGTDGQNGVEETPTGLPLEKPSADEHGVRVAGTETSDFGSGDVPACRSEVSEIDRDAARELGFDVDEQWQRLESPPGVSMRACSGSGEGTTLKLEFEVLSITLNQVSPDPNVIEEGLDCGEDFLSYHTVARSSTSDGSMAGAFYLTVNGSYEDELDGFETVDIRNFDGTMTFPVDMSRSHFAQMEVVFLMQGDSEPEGFFRPIITYVDDPASWKETRGELIEFPSSGTGYCDGFDEVSDAPPMALSDYVGAIPPATFPVSVSVDAFEGVVDLTVSVDGEVVEERKAVEGASIELGDFAAGTEVAVVTTAVDGATFAGSAVLVNGCVIAADRCGEEGCEATAKGVVQAVDCREYLY